MNDIHKPIIKRIIDDLVGRYSDNIMAIYGIGSYFDDALPPNWVKKDIDIITIVNSLKNIPKPEWTDVPYKKKELNGNQVWIGFNTIKAYQDRYSFSKQSFSNYEWSLIELKSPANSKLLYGEDIRDQLPKTEELHFDYDDILARGLYHIDKSIIEQDLSRAKKELSKGIFKLAFYICIFFASDFRNTSILKIGKNLKQLGEEYEELKKLYNIYEEAIIFRISGQYKSDFIKLREGLILNIFTMLQNGSLHEEMNYVEVVKYLTSTFNGFNGILRHVQDSNLFEEKKVKIENIILGMRNIIISGRIKKIFGVYKFDREEGTKGKVGSFLLSDSTGEIRVVLWEDHVKHFRSNDFNVGTSLYIIDGYTKMNIENQIEIHISSYGNIYLLPENQKRKTVKKITRQEITKRLDFIKQSKSSRIPCPFCGFLCSPSFKKCKKCGEPLTK